MWNASRFILMNCEGHEVSYGLPEQLETEDKWVLSLFNTLCADVTENLEKFELGLAVQKLYDFIWDIFCDWYIELAKARLQGENASSARQVLVWVMSNTLKLMHPFMPFITEEIWQSLPHNGVSIMNSKWPEYDVTHDFPAEEAAMERVMVAIRAIRNRRAEMNVPPSKKASVYIGTNFKEDFEGGVAFIKRLAYSNDVTVGDGFDIPDSVQIVTSDARIYIPMGELVDIAKEIARLEKEKLNDEKMLAGIESKLGNEGFVAKAPENVVAAEREKAAKLREKIVMVQESINALKK
jgi:valyl-tRNA synthetase